MNIYLCGMIGSGKTTVGREACRRTGAPFVDLDQEMDRRLGYSFHRLVKEQGWLPFRELEYQICKDFSRLNGTVVCLGGGTVRYAWNLDALAGTGPLVLMEAREETLIERVRHADRPRVNPDADLAGDIRRMWAQFEDRYRKAADYAINTDERSLDAEVRDLLELMQTTPGFSACVGERGELT